MTTLPQYFLIILVAVGPLSADSPAQCTPWFCCISRNTAAATGLPSLVRPGHLQGFEKTGLGERVATLFVKAFGKSTLGLAYGLAFAEAAIAPAMPSTTARAGGIFMPIMSSLSQNAGSLPGKTSYLTKQHVEYLRLRLFGFIQCDSTEPKCLQTVRHSRMALLHNHDEVDCFSIWTLNLKAILQSSSLDIYCTHAQMYLLSPRQAKTPMQTQFINQHTSQQISLLCYRY